MINFKEFLEYNGEILTEELHKELIDILNSDAPSQHKLNRLTKKTRELIKSGQDTGLTNDKPKKGSSRAVFFPNQNKPLHIDGKPTEMRTAVKVAFPGVLDNYKTSKEPLLGELQNNQEADHFIRNNYGMLSEDNKGHYTTNHNGVLAPVVGSHDEGHHLEMGHVSPIKKSDFQRLTKTESHPKGIKFDDMYNAVNKEYHDAHGSRHYVPSHHTDELHEHIMSHPYVENLVDMMHNTGFHPGDISIRNMGIWKHPHTGKEYPVMSDYGFSTEVAKAYSIRRRRHATNDYPNTNDPTQTYKNSYSFSGNNNTTKIKPTRN